LAVSITDPDEDTALLDGTIQDCYRSLPLENTTEATRIVNITGIAGGSGNYLNAELTRFYVREAGSAWTIEDHRLKIGGQTSGMSTPSRILWPTPAYWPRWCRAIRRSSLRCRSSDRLTYRAR